MADSDRSGGSVVLVGGKQTPSWDLDVAFDVVQLRDRVAIIDCVETTDVSCVVVDGKEADRLETVASIFDNRIGASQTRDEPEERPTDEPKVEPKEPSNPDDRDGELELVDGAVTAEATIGEATVSTGDARWV